MCLKSKHIILCIIIVSSLGLKLYETDFSEPIFSDATEYNTFAWDIAHGIKDLPVLHNLGFSIFLAPIFYFVSDFQTSSVIQKAVSVTFSIITIPVFFMLASRFLPPRYALLAAGLIAIEPHIIQNVSFGITEPQYLFLFVTSLLFVTSKNHKIVMLSFVIAGLATVTRFEGVSLLCVLVLVYLYRYRKIPMLALGIMLFMIPVSFTVYYNLDYGTHENVMTSKINHEVAIAKDLVIHKESMLHKIFNSVLYLGWSTYPVFIGMIPIGLYFMARQKKLRYIIPVLVILAIPGLFAYIRAYDTRYFMQLYPILAMLGSYSIMNLLQTKTGERIIHLVIPRTVKVVPPIIAVVVIVVLVGSLTHVTSSQVFATTSNTIVIYPTYTLSAYDKAGFYTYYKGLCDTRCLVIPDRFDNLDRITLHDYGIDTIRHLGFRMVSDSDVDSDPAMLSNYSTVILLHNEYVTQKEFDAITHHKNVVYLYPNALYALVQRDLKDNSLTLIKGHNYPAPDIRNGFNWKYDNSPLEYNRACHDMKFYSVPNGHMLNCYPEDIINSDQHLWDMISKLKI